MYTNKTKGMLRSSEIHLKTLKTRDDINDNTPIYDHP